MKFQFGKAMRGIVHKEIAVQRHSSMCEDCGEGKDPAVHLDAWIMQDKIGTSLKKSVELA